MLSQHSPSQHQGRPGTSSTHSWWFDSLLLVTALSLLYFILLGTRPLFVPDEGRYAEIAREMVIRHDYITPHLNSIKYFEKPALFYWLAAGMIKLFGPSIWAVRSVNAILSVLGCLLIYLTGRQLYNRETGLLAAGILGTSALYFVMGHTISLDLPVTVFITGNLCGFILATQASSPSTRRSLMYASSFAAALAVLTKGLIGIILPGLIVFTWLLLTKEWRLLARLYIPTSLLLFFLIATPWHLIVGLRNPEFFFFYFIEQHFLRYTTVEVGHYQPVWYFIPIFIICFFPWIVFLPQAFKQVFSKEAGRQSISRINLFLFLWATLIFLFFSFSKSKLIPYILPVIPPLSLLTAHTLRLHLIKGEFKTLMMSGASLGCFAALIAYFYIAIPYYTALPDPHRASILLTIAAVILLSGSAVTFFCLCKQHTYAFVALLISTALFLLCSLATLPALDKRTILPLANTLNTMLIPDDEVITYNQYHQDLPFYLKRRIGILNWKNELSFGMQHQNTNDWMITDDTFWQRWHSHIRVFTIIGTDDYEKFKVNFQHEKHYVIDQTITNVLISNMPK